MIEPFYDLGMTDDQLKAIGMISLNWSTVEREITDILHSFYSFPDEQDAIDLVVICDKLDDINRVPVSAKRLMKAAAGDLKVSMRCVDSRLSGTPEPNSNPHSEGG